jgi:hypothetical protein
LHENQIHLALSRRWCLQLARLCRLARRDKSAVIWSTPNRHIRVTHHLDLTASMCPFCKSRDVIAVTQRSKGMQTRHKRAYDIVVTIRAFSMK